MPYEHNVLFGMFENSAIHISWVDFSPLEVFLDHLLSKKVNACCNHNVIPIFIFCLDGDFCSGNIGKIAHQKFHTCVGKLKRNSHEQHH
jgi:hypothetical protein